jgi:hypothetical protein
MEAIWNFFYWQALTTNAMDDIGKVLRLSVIVNECSPYTVKPSPDVIEECNQFLGPTQPGVTTPDPTEGAAAATAPTAPAPAAPAPPAAQTAPAAPGASPAPDDTDTAALDFLLGE